MNGGGVFRERVLPVMVVIVGIILIGYPLALVFGLPLAQRDRDDMRKWLRETALAEPAARIGQDGTPQFEGGDGVAIFADARWVQGEAAVTWGSELAPVSDHVLSVPDGAFRELYVEDVDSWRHLEAGALPPVLPPDGARDRFTFGGASGPVLLGDSVMAEGTDYVHEAGAVVFAQPPPFGADLRRVSGDYALLADGLVVLHQDAELTGTVRAALAAVRSAPLMTGEADGTNREFAFPFPYVIEADRERLVHVGDELLSDTAERPAERVDGITSSFTFDSERGLVVVDGTLKLEGNDYAREGNVVSFTSPPERNAQLRQYRDYWLKDPGAGLVLMTEPPPAGAQVWTSRFMHYSGPACGETLMECFYALPQHPVPFPHWIAERTMPFMQRYPVNDERNVLRATLYTSTGTALALVLGGTLGVLLAVLFVAFRPLERALLPWTIASQTVPIIALVPVLLLVLGNFGITIQTSMLPTALVGAYLCFFPVAVSTTKGLRAVEPLVVDLMKSYAATPLQVFLKVRLPAATPFLFTGLKLGMAAAFVGALVSEVESNNRRGLGYQILGQVQSGNVADVWILLLISSLLGILLVGLVGLAQRVVAPWERAR